MKAFKVIYTDSKGNKHKEKIVFSDQESLIRNLHDGNNLIIEIQELDAEAWNKSNKLNRQEILEFTQGCSLLINTGLEVQKAIEILHVETNNSNLKDCLLLVLKNLNSGRSLSDSLSFSSSSFDSLFLAQIKIGEKTNDLKEIFNRLTTFLIDKQKIYSKLKNSLTYPLFILCIAILGMIGLSIFVLPNLLSMFNNINPQSSEQISKNYDVFQTTMKVVLFSIGFVFMFIFGLGIIQRSNSELRLWISKAVFYLPGLNIYQEARNGFYFSYSMQILLKAGYTFEASLIETENIITNLYLRTQIKNLVSQLNNGETLSVSLKKINFISKRFSSWIEIGNSSGDLTKVFDQLRIFYSQKLENIYSRFLSLIEPLIMVIIGLFLIVIIVNFINPIFNAMGNVL